MTLQPFVGPWSLFQCLDLFTQSVGLLGRGISPSQGRCLHTGEHKDKINAQASMPQGGFEPTFSVFEWTNTFHAFDRATTVVGYY
jgi:hypothetical protein